MGLVVGLNVVIVELVVVVGGGAAAAVLHHDNLGVDLDEQPVPRREQVARHAVKELA